MKVARLDYNSCKIADIDYPPEKDINEAKGVVILFAGDTNAHAQNWYGRL